MSFDRTEYLLGWGVYLLATFGACWLFWISTRWIGLRDLRDMLRILFAALLLTPVASVPGSSYMSPALFTIALEALSEGGDPARAVPPLLACAAAGLVLALLVSLFRRR